MIREEEIIVADIIQEKDANGNIKETIEDYNVKRKIIPILKSNKKIHTDCFAYNDRKCSALNALYCIKEECRFYKTEKQRLKELELNEKRMKEEEN